MQIRHKQNLRRYRKHLPRFHKCVNKVFSDNMGKSLHLKKFLMYFIEHVERQNVGFIGGYHKYRAWGVNLVNAQRE
jgi:hypothetical protein